MFMRADESLFGLSGDSPTDDYFTVVITNSFD